MLCRPSHHKPWPRRTLGAAIPPHVGIMHSPMPVDLQTERRAGDLKCTAESKRKDHPRREGARRSNNVCRDYMMLLRGPLPQSHQHHSTRPVFTHMHLWLGARPACWRSRRGSRNASNSLSKRTTFRPAHLWTLQQWPTRYSMHWTDCPRWAIVCFLVVQACRHVCYMSDAF